MTFLSREQFTGYYNSSHWQRTRRAALDYYGHKCAVCDLDFRERGDALQVHHCHYWTNGKHVFYRETMRDLALLCESHHPRGKFSRESIRRWRSSYRWVKRVKWLFRLLRRKG